QNLFDEMGSGCAHPPTGARWAKAAPFTGKGHQATLAARAASKPREASAQEPMQQRQQFIGEYLQQQSSLAELCRALGTAARPATIQSREHESKGLAFARGHDRRGWGDDVAEVSPRAAIEPSGERCLRRRVGGTSLLEPEQPRILVGHWLLHRRAGCGRVEE